MPGNKEDTKSTINDIQESSPETRKNENEEQKKTKKNKLSALLVILAIGGIIWFGVSVFKKGSNIDLQNTSQNFKQFTASELGNKCNTPEGYTDREWLEHMSHHPERYKECPNLEKEQTMNTYKNIEPNDLVIMLENKDFTLIDTHTPEQAHIPGTDKFIPFNEIETRLKELPQDKNAKIVLYCRSGSMSKTASETLINLGYKNVYNLEGGVNGWKTKGYKVEKVSL